MQLLMKSFEFSFSQRKHIDSMMGFMCYYGHVQNTSNLGEGNVYKSYFLGALVEIPCWLVTEIFLSLHVCFFCFDHKVQIFTIGSGLFHLSLSRCDGVLSFCHLFYLIFFLRSVPFIIAKMGRRWPLLFLFTCSGICGVVYGFIPDDLPRWASCWFHQLSDYSNL